MQYLLLVLPILLLVPCCESQTNGVSNGCDEGVGVVSDCFGGTDDCGGSLDPPEDAAPPHILLARANLGQPPADSVNVWLAFVRLPPGNPWCAAVQSAWLDQAGVSEPRLKTGLARNYVYQTPQRLHIAAGRVLAGVERVPPGSLVVYKRGETIFGHIGAATEEWQGQYGVYISGNISPPGGAEATGGGVWEKPAGIHPNAHLRITHFIRVKYD